MISRRGDVSAIENVEIFSPQLRVEIFRDAPNALAFEYRHLTWTPRDRVLRPKFAICSNPERLVRSSVVGFVLPAHRSQKVIQHKVRNLSAQPLTSAEVKPEMLPTKDSA